MKSSYRVTKWGDGSFTVDFVTKNHEEPVKYLSPMGVRFNRFSDLEDVKKAIEQHKRKQKASKILDTLWFDETTEEFH